MTNIDKIYNNLVNKILNTGVRQDNRTGTETVSIFGEMLKYNMGFGFPLLTTKKVWYPGVLHELLWFISGSTNIKYLIENDVHIWDAWPYKKYKLYRKYIEDLICDRPTDNDFESSYYDMSYIPYVFRTVPALRMELNSVPELTQKEFNDRIINNKSFRKWGELGPIYGYQWTNWGKEYRENKTIDYTVPEIKGINQIAKIQNTLRTNPDSRRMMVNALNVSDLDIMALDPCHYSFQFHSEKVGNKRKLSLLWNQRSVDTFLGLPFNIASYATLLLMMAHTTDHIPGDLIASLGNTHIYTNHFEQIKLQLSREPYKKIITLDLNRDVTDIFDFKYEDFNIPEYKYHPSIKAPVAV